MNICKYPIVYVRYFDPIFQPRWAEIDEIGPAAECVLVGFLIKEIPSPDRLPETEGDRKPDPPMMVFALAYTSDTEQVGAIKVIPKTAIQEIVPLDGFIFNSAATPLGGHPQRSARRDGQG